MNEFRSDDTFQREKRNKYILPWYRRNAYVTLVDDNKDFQTLGIDTILIGHQSRKVINVEEKVVRWKGRVYDAFTLETKSCTIPGYESAGWMVYSKADILFYCFTQEDGCLKGYWINFPELREWFWVCDDCFPIFKNKDKNQTEVRVVPITNVLSAVETRIVELRG